jgi:hypothetical protein
VKKILNVKSWIVKEKRQFVMDEPDDFLARRIKDDMIFAEDGSYLSRIYFENRIGHILEFRSDMVNVLIEVKKKDVIDYPGMEFETKNYDFIEVPINDVEPRRRVNG